MKKKERIPVNISSPTCMSDGLIRIYYIVNTPIYISMADVSCCRRIYWSDCYDRATIQTARVDGEDRQEIICDSGHSCIVDIAIDFESTYKCTCLSHIGLVNAVVVSVSVAESNCLEYLSKSTSIGSFSYSSKSKSIAQNVYLT